MDGEHRGTGCGGRTRGDRLTDQGGGCCFACRNLTRFVIIESSPERIMTDYKKTDRFGWTLRAKAYFDPDVYAKEQHKVFHSAYVYALHASQIPEPGSYQALTLGDSEVLIIRGADNQIRAFHNVCVHRGHLLVSRGSNGCKRQLICPYHAWQYS